MPDALILAKAVAQLVLPPGGLIVTGALGLWLAVRGRRRLGHALVFASLVFAWLLATEPVKDALLASLEDRYPPLAYPPPPSVRNAAIVVLGGGIEEHSPAFAGEDRLSRPALKRVLYAWELAHWLKGPVIVSGGVIGPSTSRPEGEIAKRLLVRLGLPPERVIAEVRARNTWENARFVQKILREQKIARFVLVTTAWHMPRAMQVFRRLGMHPIPAPCDYRRDFGEPYDLRSFLPRWTWFADSADALHEWLGMLWYALRYG